MQQPLATCVSARCPDSSRQPRGAVGGERAGEDLGKGRNVAGHLSAFRSKLPAEMPRSQIPRSRIQGSESVAVHRLSKPGNQPNAAPADWAAKEPSPCRTSEPLMASRRSCDRCYKKKEKCTYEPHAETCTPCAQSSTPCTNLRSRNRPGRRPKARAFGEHGSFHVWDPGNGSATESHNAHGSRTPSPTSSSEVDNEDASAGSLERRE